MMKMMTIEEIKKQKEVLGLTNQELADLANVPLSTVGKVLGGTTKHPRIDTVMALELALKSRGIEGSEKNKPKKNDTGEGSREMLYEPQGQYIFGANADQERAIRSNDNMPAPAEEGSGTLHETDRLHGYSVRCGNEEYEAEAHRRENSLFTEPLHTIEDYLALPQTFGVPADKRLDISIHCQQDVVNTSERIIEFCHSVGVDKKRAFYAGLCLEEMASNIVQCGFVNAKKCSADIRVVYKDDSLVLRIKDNGKPFDPTQKMKLIQPDDVTHNIGLRLVQALAKKTVYSSVLGLNVFTIVL